MAFPFTHLCVAWRILELRRMNKRDAAQFLLGSISPDAIHYRPEFQGAAMKNIGAAKKITHLCPVSNERWGHVTDNDGWVNCVRAFLHEHADDAFAAGYSAHVLTDIQNNLTLWDNFRTNHPAEAAKGYTSGYYDDLHHIDSRLYYEFPAIAGQFQNEKIFYELKLTGCTAQILATLEKAEPVEAKGLVTAEETRAIQQNLVHEHFKNITPPAAYDYRFVSYDATLDFIETAAEFCHAILQ